MSHSQFDASFEIQRERRRRGRALRRLATALFAVCLLFANAQPGLAVPAKPSLQRFQQPDGKSFQAYVRGDEHGSWFENEAGSQIAKGEDGFWYFVKGHRGGRPELSRQRADHLDPGWWVDRPPYWVPDDPSVPFDDGTLFPDATDTAVLFILVDYANAPATYTDADDWADRLADDVDPDDRSVVDYYREASYGRVQLERADETHGTSDDGVIGWLRLAGNHPNPGQYRDGTPAGQVTETSAKNAIFEAAIAAADPYIDYSQYDANGDGAVVPQELAIVVVASSYDQSTNATAAISTWPAAVTSGGLYSYDGLFVFGSYAIIGEIQTESFADHMTTLGVIVHELGHLIFGLPDLYDTDGSSAGIHIFGVMSAGAWGYDPATDDHLGETPVLPSAWTLVKLDWTEPVNPLFLTLESTATQPSMWPSDPKVGKLRLSHPTLMTCSELEYFLVQYRTSDGYDRGLNLYLDSVGADFDPGVVIFHVDETVSDNTNDRRRLVDLEEADDVSLDANLPTESTLFAEGGRPVDFDGASSPNSDFNTDWGPSTPSSVDIRVGVQSQSPYGAENVAVTMSSPCDHQLVFQLNQVATPRWLP